MTKRQLQLLTDFFINIGHIFLGTTVISNIFSKGVNILDIMLGLFIALALYLIGFYFTILEE